MENRRTRSFCRKVSLITGQLLRRCFLPHLDLPIQGLGKKLTQIKFRSQKNLMSYQNCQWIRYDPGVQNTPQFLTKHLSFLVLGSLVLLCLFSSDVLAMQKDSMEKGLTTLESYLTGNIARGIVIGGCSIAAYRAYVDSKFGVLGAAVAGALGLNFLMDFVNATYACLI